jgi:hypothetical protein
MVQVADMRLDNEIAGEAYETLVTQMFIDTAKNPGIAAGVLETSQR